jgi:hypothetical protein
LLSATGRLLPLESVFLRRVHRCVAIGALAGIPLIFVGKLVASPAVKFAGVSSIVLSTIAFAFIAAAVAFRLISPIAKRLMLASAASIFLAMVVAGSFGVVELLGRDWISIQEMVEYHGLLNALGFVLCGLSAHLVELPARERTRLAYVDDAGGTRSEALMGA